MKSCFRPCMRGKLRQALGGEAGLGQFEDFQAFHLQEDRDGRVVDAAGLPELEMPQLRQAGQGREALAGDARRR